MRVRDTVRFDGAGTADAALLMPLAEAQRLFSRPGEVKVVLVSNRGDALAGAALSDEVSTRLEPLVGSLGLEVQTVKQDAIEDADAAGNAFMAFFTTFGTFSIAAGILLIFLIFVMLAAERRASSGSRARSERGAGTSSRCSRSKGSRTTSQRRSSAPCSERSSRSEWSRS